MQDDGNAEGFLVDGRPVGSGELVDNGLSIEPGAHYMVVSMSRERGMCQLYGSVYERGVGDRNAGYDAGKSGENSNHGEKEGCETKLLLEDTECLMRCSGAVIAEI